MLFPLLFLVFLACQDNKTTSEAASKNETEIATDTVSLEKMCFLTTSGAAEIQGKIVQDSLVLKLGIEGNKVSGVFNWIPAEKDSRRGKLLGTKKGNLIRGDYRFVQEGKEQTQPIQIELRENLAKVIINGGKEGEMRVEIEKVECAETF